MTIKEAQELVEAWNEKNGVRNGELVGVASLTEKVGAVARAVSDGGLQQRADAVSELFWSLLSMASDSGIDLTDGLIDSLEKKSGGR